MSNQVFAYYAIDTNGNFFIGKRTQIAYTNVGPLKNAMRYQGKDPTDYTFYKLESNGISKKL